ncbi:MAG: type II toxin-antitoxin system VapC family toxin [Verrucomicrobia bacterium]|nr:type II toxin-antitoxin system VapC family toxin [Verrucomicrobiota bacterium]
MSHLLDTHSFLWSAFCPKRLSQKARAAMTDPTNDILVSAVSFWEISLKCALGKLELTGTSPDQLPQIAESMGFALLPLSAEEAASFHRLPREAHRDPFDRMLVWQAISRKVPLITKDQDLAHYADKGLITFW